MAVVSIREARANIGKLIGKAEHGEEIIVTRNGKKVAVIHGLPERRQRLPELGDFRKKIKSSGTPLSTTVMKNRFLERF